MDELRAAVEALLADGYDADVGGADIFVSTCDAAERLRKALAAQTVSVTAKDLSDPLYIYHPSNVYGEDDLYEFASSGAVDEECDVCIRLYDGAALQAYAAQQSAKADLNAMVDRFLCWKLPKDFGPDGGISFKATHEYDTPHWPIGTNLFTATQAKEMFEYAFGGQTQKPEQDAKDAERCVWKMPDDDGIWTASCSADLAYSFMDGGPTENGHKFCHVCGKPLVVDAVMQRREGSTET